jgi:hypothetical protein
MNCDELQSSLGAIEDGSGAEQQAHLKSCRACSILMGDLKLIARAAVDLREADEPSPRLWNSLEIALRQEGLIHPPRTGRSLLPSLGARWGWARWLAPAAAALLITVGIYLHRQSAGVQVVENIPATKVVGLNASGLNDDDLRLEIADQSPTMRAQYEDNLRRVNESIVDAEGDVKANPNDEEARRSLVEAYEQKAMLFEMAMEPSLP